MRRLRRVAAVFLLAAGAVAVTAPVANAKAIGSCTAQGNFAVCSASGTAIKPLTLSVTVTSSPAQSVSVAWEVICSQGTGAGSAMGSFTAKTPVTRTISHPYHQPDSCDVAADAQLSGDGKSIKVVLSSPSIAPPPVTAIKGQAGKCVDDAGNSPANGTKVQIWSCTKGAPQNWTFSGGLLKHNGKCLTDPATGGSGTKVVLFTCTTASNDIWAHKSNGEYALKARGGTLCLTDPGNSAKNGTQLMVFACKNTADQHWTLP